MRTLRVLLAAAALLAVTGGASRAATPPEKPPVVSLRWHLVARGVTDVEASDRYLAYETSPGLTLVDQQTHAVTELPASACPAPGQLGPLLGGPWVAECRDQQSHQTQLPLYNIVEHEWVPVPWPGCTACAPVAVGSQWIEIVYGCQAHCSPVPNLENLISGESELDPVQPHGDFREDLNSPTGTSALCAPLHYPAWFDGATQQVEPGSLVMLGQFALATGLRDGSLLERCHSNWRKWLYGSTVGGSSMVLWSGDYWVYGRKPDHGLLLPSLRRFNFSIPHRLHPGQTPVAALVLSGRTIYVLTERHALWSARVPRIR